MSWTVGKWTYGDSNILTFNGNRPDPKLTIGNYCSIAHNIKVYLAEHHHLEWTSTFPFNQIAPGVFNSFVEGNNRRMKGDGNVVIGNDVWLCGNVTIMAGVTIGDGAVVANNSHVIKDVPPYAVVGGNPAKVIKFRFSPAQIEKFLKIKWWYWTDEKVNENLAMICSPDVDAFLNRHIMDVIGDGEVSDEVKNMGVKHLRGGAVVQLAR